MPCNLVHCVLTVSKLNCSSFATATAAITTITTNIPIKTPPKGHSVCTSPQVLLSSDRNHQPVMPINKTGIVHQVTNQKFGNLEPVIKCISTVR